MSIFKNSLLGLDLFLSTLTGGLPGTTLSGRTGSNLLQGNLRGKIFAPIIDFIMRKKGHCVAAIQGDKERAEAVEKDNA